MLYRLYALSVSDATTSQSLDIRMDDVVNLVQLSVSANSTVTTGVNCKWELGFLSAAQFGVNDTTGIISSGQICVPGSAATGPGSPATWSDLVSVPCKVIVNSGERLFLHVASDVNTEFTVYAHAYTDKSDGRPTTRRR